MTAVGPKALRAAAAVEAASLLVLLVNLFTVHAGPVASLGGPVHGSAYLVTVVATFSLTAAGPSGGAARALSFVPGAGGMLVLRWLRLHPGAVGTPDGATGRG
ncbi:hypothetical protein M4914_09610 [Streptomyces somaliensis DSM 40738]|uniref:DUF3817 domain-containing protein n=1 Tax=Streptomyces somaliensis TaxID=78355 RepID=UPI0021C295AA|nr:hypothetical protein [Streptomyces somaliensis]MCQ0023176.1 hypothetical protein [Streptomyces somaliensis DSM 40738]